MLLANIMNSVLNISGTVIQRLLAAVILLVAPGLNLPCCCQRAAAAPESVGCCEQHRNDDSSSKPGSCCKSRHRIQGTVASPSQPRNCSCECQLNEALPAIHASQTASHPSAGDQAVELAAFSESWGLPAELKAAPGWDSAAFQIPVKAHNRHQAELCVWRN